MPEFIMFLIGVGFIAGGYRMATTGYDPTRKPSLFYPGWALTLLGCAVASGAVFYFAVTVGQ